MMFNNTIYKNKLYISTIFIAFVCYSLLLELIIITCTLRMVSHIYNVKVKKTHSFLIVN